MKITIDSYIFELVYNYFQNVLEKLRKLRKSCNYKRNIKEYILTGCTTIASNNYRRISENKGIQVKGNEKLKLEHWT